MGTKKPDSLLDLLFNKMVKEKKSPCFEVYGSQIEIITTPEDYYLALHKLLLEAKFRINMSALYLGTGHREKFFLNRLQEKIINNTEIRVLKSKFEYIGEYGSRLCKRNEVRQER